MGMRQSKSGFRCVALQARVQSRENLCNCFNIGVRHTVQEILGDRLLMQFQADVAGVPVVRPKVIETTALGAAYASGIAVGFWSGTQDVVDNWAEGARWEPAMEQEHRERLYRLWKKAVTKTLDWVDADVDAEVE